MGYTGFQVCPGVTYVRVRELAEMFKPLGHTHGSFSAWLTAMLIPKVTMPDGHDYVTIESFQLALTTLSTIGTQLQTFITPTPVEGAPNLATIHSRLSRDHYELNWKLALAQTYLSTKLAGISDTVFCEIRSAFEVASQRLAIALARMTEYELASRAKEAGRIIPEPEGPERLNPDSAFLGPAAVISYTGAGTA